MNPYYEQGGITLYHCRAEELLAALAPQSANVTLTDPPYAEQTHTGARRARPGMAGSVPLLDFDCMTEEELRAAFIAIGRVTRTWAVSFMDWRHIYSLECEPPSGLRFVRFGIWVKPNGAPQFTGDRPATGWEGIAMLHHEGGRMIWNGGGRNAVFTYPKVNGQHHTQKPEPLIAELVQLFSNRGDLVCDPFLGSGTTAVACKRLGRRFIGCDINADYLDIAVRRLQQAVMPLESVSPMHVQSSLWSESP